MDQPTSGPTAALELHNIRKRFGATEIIWRVNLTIGKGERHALIGPDDADESITFNLVSGRFPASSGSVRLDSEETNGLAPFEIDRRDLSHNFRITNIFHRLSVFENLRCAVLRSLGYKYLFWHKLAELRDTREHAREILEQIGIAHRCEAATGLLTYTERRTLEIGITIAGDVDVILLDEPTAGMSRSGSDHVVEFVREIMMGKTLVMVEYGMSAVPGLTDHISILVYGGVIATDTPEVICSNQRVKETYLGITLDEPVGTH